jgi:hypothetical protein
MDWEARDKGFVYLIGGTLLLVTAAGALADQGHAQAYLKEAKRDCPGQGWLQFLRNDLIVWGLLLASWTAFGADPARATSLDVRGTRFTLDGRPIPIAHGGQPVWNIIA